MSNFSASIPAANMQAANAELEELGHGPNNFSVPAYDGPSPAVALLHAWGDPEFEAAVAAIPNVTITQGTDPSQMTTEAATAEELDVGTGRQATDRHGHSRPVPRHQERAVVGDPVLQHGDLP